jgi:formylglycine-generating enzyme required for sulfatase activity
VNLVRLVIGAVALCTLLAASAHAAQGPDADKVITNSIGMKLTLIPAGRFLMGSPADEAERDPEEAQHEVAITKPFYMGVYEVTQAQYRAIYPKHNAHFNEKNGGGPDHPVEQVRWREAVEYCAKLSALPAEKKAGRVYRLPTEAEWEYACRARSKTAFNVGDTLSAAQANFNGNAPYGKADKGPHHQKTMKVGSYAPNAFGLYDMHGNVMEWCADWYDPAYYKNSPKEDPSGPAEGVVPTGFAKDYFHVVRGGCWLDEGRACRSAYRFRLQSSEPYRLVGFRVVCTVAAQ